MNDNNINTGDDLEKSSSYQDLMNTINGMLQTYDDKGNPIDHVTGDLEQFRKTWFYHDWTIRFRTLMAFRPQGLRGRIAIPNTTFEEWLVWFYEWALAFEDDYNKFKKLVLEAITAIEKHLEIVDHEIDDIQDHLKKIDGQIAEINKQLIDINKAIGDIINQIKKLGGDVTNIQKDMTNVTNTANNANQQAQGADQKAQNALDQLKKVAIVDFMQSTVTNVNYTWLQYGATNDGDARRFWIQPRVLTFINGTKIAGLDIHNYLKKTKALDESHPVVLFTIEDSTNTFADACTRTPFFVGPHLVWYGSHDNPNDHNFYYGGTLGANNSDDGNPTTVFDIAQLIF